MCKPPWLILHSKIGCQEKFQWERVERGLKQIINGQWACFQAGKNKNLCLWFDEIVISLLVGWKNVIS